MVSNVSSLGHTVGLMVTLSSYPVIVIVGYISVHSLMILYRAEGTVLAFLTLS